jgi:hypothetical protein
MPELNREEIREEIIKGLECFHTRILNTKLAEKITETEIMTIINALTLIEQLTEEKREIFEEIEYILNHIGYLDHIDFEKLKKKYIGKTE